MSKVLRKSIAAYCFPSRSLALAIIVHCPALLGAGGALTLSLDGLTVYDSANGVTWLADFNLPATNRFGLPVCGSSSIDTKTCVNASGSMSYQAAAAWVQAMNAANYLGHSNWQIPTTPIADNACSFVGPQNNSFGWGCVAGALASVYNTLGLKAPGSAVPPATVKVGPFTNFQPGLYWTGTSVQQPSGFGCCAAFSFNSGWQGSNIAPNFLFVLPMIQGKISGTPATVGTGLQINPGGQTVYDPLANVTWLANANVAATNPFSLPPCTAPGSPHLCVSQSGAMNSDSAFQFAANMNAAAYLGQTNWELPVADPNCASSYLCPGTTAPLQTLFYTQLGLVPGMPVVSATELTAGPFTGIRPYLYWTCGGDTVAAPCQYTAAPGFQFSFWFNNGFEGTDVLAHDMYVTAYFPGSRSSTANPEISEVANAEGESPVIAPNTWVEIKGVNLAPSGDTRIWQGSDFSGNQMPAQLDKVSATVNGKSAYIYYISPTQINILTPPDAISGTVAITVTNNGVPAAAFTTQAQTVSPSFFVFNGGPYVAGEHINGSLIGPATLYPGSTTPAKPGETIMIYANGFGATNVPAISGSSMQSGTLSPLPVVQIGGIKATVQYAGLVGPGEFQFNVVIPQAVPNGDQAIMATYGGSSTQSGALINIHN
jgi:uncharacterized protein (TIGR03437 family)